jgi:hypothetical protein
MIAERTTKEYHKLLDSDPAGAIAYARALDLPAPLRQFQRGVLASCLTDGGAGLHDPELVVEGEGLWREIRIEKADARSAYNHGNALQALWSLDARHNGLLTGWQRSQQYLRECRVAFLDAIETTDADGALTAQCAVNIGNSYDEVGRGVEAVEMYDVALRAVPGFAMALGNRGIALMHMAPSAMEHSASVYAEAYWDLADALANRDGVLRYGGRAAVKSFEERIARWKKLPSKRLLPLRPLADPYASWIQRNNLFLHMSRRCVADTTEDWDPLYFRSIRTPIQAGLDADDLVPEPFKALNTLKQEFAAARLLTWIATSDTTAKDLIARAGRHTRYIDTLDYARYDLFAGLARQAFQAGNNLLDKIASFIALYLGISNRKVYFRGWWKANAKQKNSAIHPAVLTALDPVNLGFWALVDLTADFEDGGRYAHLERLRHAATHRLVVQHDEFGRQELKLEGIIVHLGQDDFGKMLVDQLRVGRAALIYLVQGIDRQETRRPGDTNAPAMPLPRWKDWTHRELRPSP